MGRNEQTPSAAHGDEARGGGSGEGDRWTAWTKRERRRPRRGSEAARERAKAGGERKWSAGIEKKEDEGREGVGGGQKWSRRKVQRRGGVCAHMTHTRTH
eukprot:204159-Rhodomonas_salina.1